MALRRNNYGDLSPFPVIVSSLVSFCFFTHLTIYLKIMSCDKKNRKAATQIMFSYIYCKNCLTAVDLVKV